MDLLLDRRKVDHKIFEVLLEAARARRHARHERLARLIRGVTASPRPTPTDGVDVRAVRGLALVSSCPPAISERSLHSHGCGDPAVWPAPPGLARPRGSHLQSPDQ